jgi:hypothetical protein
VSFELPNPYDYKYDVIRLPKPRDMMLRYIEDEPLGPIMPAIEYSEFRRQWLHHSEKGEGAAWVDENGERVSPVFFGKEKPIKKLDSPLMGVREWNVGKDGKLGSTSRGGVWSEGTQKATCKGGAGFYNYSLDSYDLLGPVPSHPAPHKGCGCGLYAFYTQDSLIKYGDNFTSRIDGVSGVVSAWGKIIRCEYGFRAEYMRVEAFIMEHAERSFWGTTVDFRGAYEALAKKYGVPLIKSYEVSAFIGLSGGSVLECGEAPPRPVTDASVIGSAFLWSMKPTYTPTRVETTHHFDSRTGEAWVEYSDGSTKPLDPKDL